MSLAFAFRNIGRSSGRGRACGRLGHSLHRRSGTGTGAAHSTTRDRQGGIAGELIDVQVCCWFLSNDTIAPSGAASSALAVLGAVVEHEHLRALITTVLQVIDRRWPIECAVRARDIAFGKVESNL